jgi:hypothetical protein
MTSAAPVTTAPPAAYAFAEADGPPLRLVFVGQTTYFAACSMQEPARGVLPFFVDFRAGADAERMLGSVRALEPDAILAFRPEIFPEGAFANLDALTIGFLTEPIPRTDGEAHPDLERRLGDLRAVDPRNFDRIISFDPLMAATADRILPVWRSLPLPVADRLFLGAHVRADPPRMLFVGRSTEHREVFLGPAKHEHDIIHIAHGVTDEHLLDYLREVDVALNLHNEPYPTFENRVSVSLAAGLVVVTEPLSPTHGLEPGVDYLEVHNFQDLLVALFELRRNIGAFRRVRVRGRAKAEQYRASRVYPALVRDAMLDVRAFGSPRRAGSR